MAKQSQYSQTSVLVPSTYNCPWVQPIQRTTILLRLIACFLEHQDKHQEARVLGGPAGKNKIQKAVESKAKSSHLRCKKATRFPKASGYSAVRVKSFPPDLRFSTMGCTDKKTGSLLYIWVFPKIGVPLKHPF